MQRASGFRLALCFLIGVAVQAQTQPALRPLATGFTTPVGLDLDAAAGKLYAVEFSGEVSVTDIATGVRQIIGRGYTQPEDIRLTPDRTRAYVTERSGPAGAAPTPGDVVRISLSKADRAAAELIVSGLSSPQQMSLSPDGNSLYTVEFDAPGRLVRIDTNTKQMTVITSGLAQAVGVLVPSNQTFALVTEQGAGGGRVSRVPLPAGIVNTGGGIGIPSPVVATNLPSVFFLNWSDATQQRIQVPQRSPVNRVVAIDLRNPVPIPVVGNVPFQPSSVVASPNGEIYISSDGVISRFGPVNIKSLAPASAVVGGSGFSLTVTGGIFSPGAFVQWNGTDLPTTFVSSSQLTATVNTSLVANSSGAVPVTVVSGGVTSNAAPFAMDPHPAITALSPNTLAGGAPAFTLTVAGNAFSPGTIVQWNATPLPTTFVNANQVSAAVPASLVAATGTATVTVGEVNYTSSGLPFLIVPPPVLSSLNPLSATVQGAPFGLTINGTGFGSTAIAQWNGTPLTTLVSGPTQLTAAIPASLLMSQGTASITVLSGGVVSNALPFQVVNRPTISSLNPPTAVLGGPAFTLTVNGSGFVSGATVQWNGTALATTFVSTTQLTAQAPANLVATQGSAAITVVLANGVTSPPVGLPISSRLTITTLSPLPPAAAGSAYNQALAATGGSGAGLTWRPAAPLPAWLTLSPAGVLTGVPPSGTASVTFSVTVTDSVGNTASGTFTLPVGSALSIDSPSSLPNGTPQAPYLYSFRASGGAGAGYTWSGAGQPTWLTLSPTGLLSGTPPANSGGTYTFTVSVTDLNAASTNGRFTLIVATQPAPTLASVSPASTAASGVPFTLTATGSNYAQSAVIQWNGSPLTTRYTDSSHLSATVPASLIADSGAASITVNSQSVVSNAISLGISGPPASGLSLSQTGFTFQAALNGPAPPPGTFRVLSSGAPLPFTVAVSTLGNGPRWLSATPLSGSTDSNPLVTVQVDPAGLAPGDYYGQLLVSSANASNTQTVTVILVVSQATVNPGPLLDPVGLVFVGIPGGPAPPARSITINNPNAAAVTFSSSAVFPDPLRWFTYDPAGGSIASGGKLTVTVRPNVGNLNPGVYQAQLRFQFSDGTTRQVTVVLVVAAGAQTAGSTSPHIARPAADTTCTPTQLIPVIVLLLTGEGFSATAGGPTPIAVVAVDNCGAPLGLNGSVQATFSNGDPQLPLRSEGGASGGDDLQAARWSGTWVVRHARADSMTVTITAQDASRTLKGVTYFGGTVQDNLTAPIIEDGAVVGSAAFNGSPAPGALVTVTGSRLADDTVIADVVPLPVDLKGTSIVVGETALPMLFSSPTQINAILPFGITVNMDHPVVVRRGMRQSGVQSVGIREAQPAIFTTDGSGQGQGHIYNAFTNVLAGKANPATAGDVVVIYCAGLGAVDPPVTAGAATPASPLISTVKQPVVTIGGVPATVLFSGLTPTFTGLYQLNVRVPNGVAPGDAPVVVTVGDTSSPPNVSMSIR